MSLYGFYENRQPDKLNWIYSRRALYKNKLGAGLAKQRFQQMFAAKPVDVIVDEVC